MKLHTCDPAPNPRRVNLFLAVKGIRIPTVQVDLRAGEHLGEAFRRLNPRCIVPVLELDDGSVLCDGLAICWYLESLYPDPPLLGRDALQTARILSWEQMSFTDGFMPAADILRNRSQAFRDRAVTGPAASAQIPALVERGRERLHQFWRYLETHLDGRRFIVGDSLTFADINTLVIIDFAGWSKESVPAECPKVLQWMQRIRELLPPEQR